MPSIFQPFDPDFLLTTFTKGLQNSMGLPETHEQVGPPLNMGADNISGSEPDPLTGVEQDMDQEMDGEMKLQIN